LGDLSDGAPVVTPEHYKDHTLWPNVEFYFYTKTAYKALTAA